MADHNRNCGCSGGANRRPSCGCRGTSGSAIPSCGSGSCGCSRTSSSSSGGTAWTSERCCRVPWYHDRDHRCDCGCSEK
ncbi:MAG: hypothetical protein MR884_09835 [Clostridiales bacterium]|nr:hypothetical protein [Clostridiales bacterium]